MSTKLGSTTLMLNAGIGVEQALILLRDLYDACPHHRSTSYGNPCLNHHFLARLLPLCVDPLLFDDSHPWHIYDALDGRSGCLVWSFVSDSAASMDRRSLQEVRARWNSPVCWAPRLNHALRLVDGGHVAP